MKEIWKNTRARAGITLGLWIIFIAFVFILASTAEPKNNTLKKDEVSISNLVNTLLDNPISYKITYETKDLTIKKTLDVSYKDKTYTGYLEDSNGITKFKCDLDICYKVNLESEEEIEDYYFTDELNILNIKKVVDNLKEDKDHNYSYIDEDKLSYKVFIEDNKITKIIYDNDTYTTTFDINYNQ